MADTGAYVAEVARLFPPQGRWTEQDYFSLPEVMRIIELADGVLTILPHPNLDHQKTLLEIAFALHAYVKTHRLGTVLFAPLAVHLKENRIREPDILFVAEEHAAQLEEWGVEGPPDWVAEVVSPETRKTDEVDKLREYEQAGVGEYWLLDPEARTIRVCVLREGRYGQPQQCGVGERAVSTVIGGFSVAVEDVV